MKSLKNEWMGAKPRLIDTRGWEKEEWLLLSLEISNHPFQKPLGVLYISKLCLLPCSGFLALSFFLGSILWHVRRVGHSLSILFCWQIKKKMKTVNGLKSTYSTPSWCSGVWFGQSVTCCSSFWDFLDFFQLLDFPFLRNSEEIRQNRVHFLPGWEVRWLYECWMVSQLAAKL